MPHKLSTVSLPRRAYPILAAVVITVTGYAAWNPTHLRYLELLTRGFPVVTIEIVLLLGLAYFTAHGPAEDALYVVIALVVATPIAITSWFLSGYGTIETGPVVFSADGRYELVALKKKRRFPSHRTSPEGDLTPVHTAVLLRTRQGLLSREVEVVHDFGNSVHWYRFTGPTTISVQRGMFGLSSSHDGTLPEPLRSEFDPESLEVKPHHTFR
jgi:hypothetical protein